MLIYLFLRKILLNKKFNDLVWFFGAETERQWQHAADAFIMPGEKSLKMTKFWFGWSSWSEGFSVGVVAQMLL